MENGSPLIKNGKYFVPPLRDGGDFKRMLSRLSAAGAGRPVDKNGFPIGPWTPELLATAISQIDGNLSGIDLRTVQLWFQENEKGLSSENIRWLARIFGCDDPEATGEWQAELSAGQSRLTAKRRDNRKKSETDAPETRDVAHPFILDHITESLVDTTLENNGEKPWHEFSLAQRSEAIFSRPSPLDLPASVFAGAVALGFLSYLAGIHNVTYTREDGLNKQIGFIWAPNWTFLFMVFMPLFFAFVAELLIFWKNEGRSWLLKQRDMVDSYESWANTVEASSYTYKAVLLICLIFAGVFQWIGVRFIPLMNRGGDYAPDWGSIAIDRPDIISVPESIAFTGLAYFYMSVCFYLFFVGLILLYTLTHDLWRIGEASKLRQDMNFQREITEISARIMRAIGRCTILGVLIAMCMKLQTFYLNSNGENILAWLIDDMSSILVGHNSRYSWIDHNMPTQYTSLLIAISTCVVFLYGSIQIGLKLRFRAPLARMTAVIALLVAGYLLIGVFTGFSILLGVGVILAIYGLFDPEFGRGRANELGGNQSVR